MGNDVRGILTTEEVKEAWRAVHNLVITFARLSELRDALEQVKNTLENADIAIAEKEARAQAAELRVQDEHEKLGNLIHEIETWEQQRAKKLQDLDQEIAQQREQEQRAMEEEVVGLKYKKAALEGEISRLTELSNAREAEFRSREIDLNAKLDELTQKVAAARTQFDSLREQVVGMLKENG